jgi:hypothetical protein
MNLGNPWQYEVAAMMSQLGCVTLASETVEAVFNGEQLSPAEQAQYDAHPRVAYDLLSKIPRLEPIAWMIEHQSKPLPELGPGDFETPEMRKGAGILRLILAYEKLIHKGVSRNEAAHTLALQNKNISPEFFRVLVELDPNAEEGEIRKCRIELLTPGMIVQQEIRTSDGVLLISKGQEATPPLILKLKNLHARHVIAADVTISMPKSSVAFARGAS